MPTRPADVGAEVCVALSDYAVRYHRPGRERHRAACGVQAARHPAALVEDGGVFDGLGPCAMCWPEFDEPLSPWELVMMQLRMWDAHGAWEDPGSRYGRA
jgi:hypothetical protein